MADLRDEHGNPIQLTDETGKPVQLTDEFGNPMHITGIATTQTAAATGDQPQLHRKLGDEGLGVTTRKEDLKEKVKETFGSGGEHHQKDPAAHSTQATTTLPHTTATTRVPHTTATTAATTLPHIMPAATAMPSAVPPPIPHGTAAATTTPESKTSTTAPGHEKKGLMEKIKDKLPGHHHRSHKDEK